MTDTVSIKVKIAERVFSLRVSLDEEASVRQAANQVNLKIKEINKAYGETDLKDVLSMIALEFASDLTRQKSGTQHKDDSLTFKLDSLEDKLDAYLS